MPNDNVSIAIVGGEHRQYIALGLIDVNTKTFRIYANTSATYYGSITYMVN